MQYLKDNKFKFEAKFYDNLLFSIKMIYVEISAVYLSLKIV